MSRMGAILKASVVIPTHDRDDLLEKALQSVMVQRRLPYEVIVCDDVGSESTAAIVAGAQVAADGVIVRYVDSSRESVGTAGSNRNTGARIAAGDCVAFLDDDDIWDELFLELMLGKLEADVDADFSVCWTTQVRGDHREAGMRMVAGLATRDALGANPGLTGSNAVFRRSAGAAIGWFDEGLIVSNDTDLLIRLLDSGARYAIVPESLVDQIGHDHGQLTSRTERRAVGLERFRDKYKERLTWSGRRAIAYHIHSIRRVTSSSGMVRAYHLIAQVLSISPYVLFRRVARRLSGAPVIYQDSSVAATDSGGRDGSV